MYYFPSRRYTGIGGNIQRYVTMASSAPGPADPVAALLLARERQRIDAQDTHDILLAKLLELREAKIDIKSKHIFEFYKTVSSKGNKSQQKRVACLACGHSFEATGPTRLVKHLVSCALVPADVKQPFKEIMKKSEGVKVHKRQRDNLVKEEAQQLAAEHAEKQAKLVQQKLRTGFMSLEVYEADLAISKFWYANGLSFNVASAAEDSYYREMIQKIQAAPVDYVPPGRNKLAGPLLEECHNWMSKQLKDRDPDGSRTMQYGSCYLSGGWDSCANLPLINSAFITANDGGVYWRSVDTSGKVKRAEYCAALMIADIYEYGPLKVIMVITDTCPTMQKCWDIVMDEFPWMMVLPCQAHVISLLMKDIGKTKQVCSPPGALALPMLRLTYQ